MVQQVRLGGGCAMDGRGAFVFAFPHPPVDGVVHSRLFYVLVDGDAAAWQHADLAGRTVTSCTSVDWNGARAGVALCADGAVEIANERAETLETIAPEDEDVAAGAVTFVHVAAHGACLAACGGSGRVYLRTEAGEWARVGAGFEREADKTETRIADLRREGMVTLRERTRLSRTVPNFAQVAFAPDGALYACGLDGRIERHDGAWTRMDVPSTAHLTAIATSADGRVAAVGYEATALVGGAAGFRALRHASPRQTFGAVAFRGEVAFVASGRSLFRQADGDLVPVAAVNDVLGRDETIMSLDAHGPALWVVTDLRIIRLEGEAVTSFWPPDNERR